MFDKNQYHPRTTAQLIQHQSVLQEILTAYLSHNLHHAYIFNGIQGIGKATLAYLLTKHILSDNTNTSLSLDTSDTAVNNITHNIHPNLLVIEPELNENTTDTKDYITIEQTRTIKQFLTHTSISSYSHHPKIVIVDSIDYLNVNAANSLLKILEEPPAGRLFILICHNLTQILPTIVSRCVVKKLTPLTHESIFKIIQLLGIDVEEKILQNIIESKENEGSIHKLFWFLDPNNYKIFQLARNIIAKKELNKLNLLADMVKNMSYYNFKFLIEILIPYELILNIKLQSVPFDIKLNLEQEKLFKLDKANILTSFVLSLI